MPEVEGYNTKFAHSTTEGGTYTEIAKIISVTPPEVECSDIDSTHMQTTGLARTFQAGLIDSGEVEIEALYTATAYGVVVALLRDDMWFKITYSDGSSEKFNGYVKKIGKAVELDGLATFKVTCKVSGVITDAAAA